MSGESQILHTQMEEGLEMKKHFVNAIQQFIY